MWFFVWKGFEFIAQQILQRDAAQLDIQHDTFLGFFVQLNFLEPIELPPEIPPHKLRALLRAVVWLRRGPKAEIEMPPVWRKDP